MVLFLGFASLAGGVAGGIAVLVLKYIIVEDVGARTVMMGASNVISNGLVMLRYVFACFYCNVPHARSGCSGPTDAIFQFIVPLFFGSPKTWKRNTLTTSPFKSPASHKPTN